MSGLEHRRPLFYDRLETLFDYLAEVVLTFDPEVEERREAWLAQVTEAYAICAAVRRNGRTGPAAAPLEPRHLYLDEAEWQERLAGRRVVVFERHEDAAVPDVERSADPSSALARLVQARAEAGNRVVMADSEPSARGRLARLLERRTGLTVGTLERWSDISALAPGAIAVADLDVQSGLELEGLISP